MSDSSFELGQELKKQVFFSVQEKQDFDRIQGQKILNEYEEAEVRKNLRNKETVYRVPELKHVLVPQKEIKQSEPGYKERRERAINRDRGIEKYTWGSTEFTAPILEYEEKLQQDRERGKIKAPDNSESALLKLKKTVFQKQYTSDKFEADYLGKHYAEVKGEMEELNRFLDIFGKGGEKYASLTETEKGRVRMLAGVYSAMQEAMEATLAMHSIRKEGDQLLPVQLDEVKYGKDREENYEFAKKNLKDKIAESEETVATKVFSDLREQGLARLQEAGAQQMAEHPEIKERFGDLRFSSKQAYANVAELLQMIGKEENAERYQENKALIDKILNDIVRIYSLESDYSLDYEMWEETTNKLAADGIKDDDPKMKIAANRMVRSEWRKLAYTKRCTELSVILKRMLGGTMDKLGGEGLKILASYGHEGAMEKTEARSAEYYKLTEERKETYLKEACERLFRDREDKEALIKKYAIRRNAMLMEKDNAYNDRVLAFLVRKEELQEKDEEFKKSAAGKNETAALGQEAEALLAPKFKAITDYKLRMENDLTDEELIVRQAEFHDMILADKLIRDLCNMPSDVPGLTVKEKLLKKPTIAEPADKESQEYKKYEAERDRYLAKSDIFDERMQYLEGQRLRARAAALLSEADRETADPLAVLTAQEKEEAKRLCPGKTPQEQLIHFAMLTKETGINLTKAAENALTKSTPVILRFVNEKAWRDASNPLGEAVLDPVHDGTEINERCLALVEERRKSDPEAAKLSADGDVAKILYLEAKAAGNETLMRELSIFKKLHKDSIKITGDDKPLFGEPMFRGFGSSELIDTIREMDTESYGLMLTKLSAGAFLDENSDQNEIAAARELNKEGLRTYYTTMEEHYERMERKYGLEIPDITWLAFHYEEFLRETSILQVDNHFTDHDRTELDPNDPRDLRFMHLVNYFNIFVNSVSNVSLLIDNMQGFGDMSMNELRDVIMTNMKHAAADKEYLEGHPQVAHNAAANPVNG